jgi:hypothetical protein
MSRVASIIIASVVIIGAIAGIWYLRLPQTQYRMRHDYASFYKVATSKLKPGMSYEDVTSTLGPGEPVTGDNLGRLLKIVPDAPQLFPDGLLPSDTVVAYPVGKLSYMNLYFRNGLLINFVPSQFDTPEEFKSRKAGQPPQP